MVNNPLGFEDNNNNSRATPAIETRFTDDTGFSVETIEGA
jgi:transcriptional regulator CtsR